MKPGRSRHQKGVNVKTLSVPLAAIGVAFVIVASLYLFTPVNALPAFVPGYDPHLTQVQYKHGMGPLILGVGLLAYAGLQREKK